MESQFILFFTTIKNIININFVVLIYSWLGSNFLILNFVTILKKHTYNQFIIY